MYMAYSRISTVGPAETVSPPRSTSSAFARLAAALAVPALALAATLFASSIGTDARAVAPTIIEAE